MKPSPKRKASPAAVEVHLRRARRKSFDDFLARSSVGSALADIKTRGIAARLADLERELKSHTKRPNRQPKRPAADTAFMSGFGWTLARIWHCPHDGQMVQHLIKENNFKVPSFEGCWRLGADLAAIRRAVQR